MEELTIRFKSTGDEFLLIGTIEAGGAIATKEQYESFSPSYAHLYPDGKIMRYGEVIGTVDDVEVVGLTEAAIRLRGARRGVDRHDKP